MYINKLGTRSMSSGRVKCQYILFTADSILLFFALSRLLQSREAFCWKEVLQGEKMDREDSEKEKSGAGEICETFTSLCSLTLRVKIPVRLSAYLIESQLVNYSGLMSGVFDWRLVFYRCLEKFILMFFSDEVECKHLFYNFWKRFDSKYHKKNELFVKIIRIMAITTPNIQQTRLICFCER